MSYFVVDVEADGASPFNGSMVSFGAVLVSDTDVCFFGQTKPILDVYNPETYKVIGVTREEHLQYNEPEEVMTEFANWISENSVGRPIFISDNPAFDWQWINFYFHKYLNYNPFGFSARRIGDLYCGLVKDASKNSKWKKLYRKTVHDHNPVNDAKGNAEALLELKKMGLKIKF